MNAKTKLYYQAKLYEIPVNTKIEISRKFVELLRHLAGSLRKHHTQLLKYLEFFSFMSHDS